jgi:hypothetical protein
VKLRVSAAVALCVLSVGLPTRDAFAERIGFFRGQVTSAAAAPLLGDLTTLGTPVFGYFAFDPDAVSPVNDLGDFSLITGLQTLHLEAGSQTVDAAFGWFDVYDMPSYLVGVSGDQWRLPGLRPAL